MGAPNPDVTALVNELALQYWTVANRPNLAAVITAVTAQLSRLGGEINSAVIAFAQTQVTAVFTAEEALEEAHGGPPATSGSAFTDISARYQTATAQSILAATTTIINYDTKAWDSNNAVTVGANWKFTAPVTGKYWMGANASFSPTGASYMVMQIFVNGVLDSTLPTRVTNATGEVGGSSLISLNAGDFADIRCFSGSGGATLFTNAAYNWVAISYYGPN
jgi:hypothetical protein